MNFKYCIGDEVFSLWRRAKQYGYTIHYGKIKSVSYLTKNREIYYFLESPVGGLDDGCREPDMFDSFQEAVEALTKLVEVKN